MSSWALVGPALNLLIKGADIWMERSQDNAAARALAFDDGGKQKCVPFELSLVPPHATSATWALVGFLRDQREEELPPYLGRVRLGVKLRPELPPGHYEIRALFLATQTSHTHRPLLLGYGSAYALISSGDKQAIQVRGVKPDYEHLEKVREIPSVDEVITLPALPPRVLDSPTLRPSDNSPPRRAVLTSREGGDTQFDRTLLPFLSIGEREAVRRALPPPPGLTPKSVIPDASDTECCQARLKSGEKCGRILGAHDLCLDHLARVREGQKVFWYSTGERISFPD